LPRVSASRLHERGFSLAVDGLMGTPSHEKNVDVHPPCLMTKGIVEVSGFAFVLALSWI
jgi:hypothetical protein